MTALVGCAVATAPETPDPGEVGELRFPLVTSNGGALFRLSAEFLITSDATGTVQTVDGTRDETTVAVGLAPGGYTVAIADGFAIERSLNGQTFQPISALLASPKAMRVQIEPGGLAFVSYQFLIGNDTPSGTLQIAFGVITRRGQMVGTLFFELANGALAPYIGAPPPTFIAPYIITGEGLLSMPPTHDFFTGTVGFAVTGDVVGALAAVAPDMTGGNLRFAIETKPDDGQRFTLDFLSATNTAVTQLSIQTDDLRPTVPVTERIPHDPVQSQFRATIPFTLITGGGQHAASGRVDLQFQP